MERYYYVYILASKYHGTLYTGVTNNITRRAWEHRECLAPGFTRRYKVTRLVYVEQFTEAMEAIVREKQIKNWRRQWKIHLIEQDNPNWDDLYDELFV